MIKNVAMISTHGYFDPVPTLGQTDTGGQVTYVLELSKALAGRGIGVDIYTRWFDKTVPQIDPVPDHPKVRVIRIPAGPWEFIRKEEIYEVLPELTRNMADFLKDNGLQYDLFHGHYVDGGIVALDVAQAMSKPAFFTAHSLGAWKRSQMGGDPEEMERTFQFEHRINEERRLFDSVRAQSVTSEVQKERLNTLYGFDADNITIIPPGVDIERYQSVATSDAGPTLSLPSEYILCLSRIDSNKGHDYLLEAFNIVRKKMPGIHLLIGGGSPEPKQVELEVYSKMRRMIQEKGMGDRVHLVGYVPDEHMTPYYRHAQVFVLPSKFEPFGMTALEAMSCGTPMVASSFGGIRNTIVDGETGLLVDPSDSREFAQAMISLLDNERLRVRMGKAAEALARSKYSWNSIAGRFLDFYESYI